ncbi:MAG: hypothetical protein ACI4TL_01820 [Candidatus Cryptobacteroides sp.]
MRRTVLSCLIFIFLSALFSSKLSAQSESEAALLYQAALWERQVFEAENPRVATEALWAKSEAYEKAGSYSESLATLGRIPPYLLSPQERKELAYKKAELAYRQGDYGSALNFLKEQGMEPQVESPKLKKDWLGMLLTFAVPAGFVYVEDLSGALVYTLLNAASVGWIALEWSSGCYVSAVLGGALALNVSFMGAQEKVALQIQKRNSSAIKEAQRQALSSFFQASSEGRTERPE